MNIVDQKEVGIAIFIAKFKVFAASDGLNEFVRELVALDINDVIIGVLLLDAVGDGIEQMRLAEAGLAIDKQRVIRRRAFLRDGLRRRKRVLLR